jgi:hypothetical protein
MSALPRQKLSRLALKRKSFFAIVEIKREGEKIVAGRMWMKARGTVASRKLEFQSELEAKVSDTADCLPKS